MMPPLPGVLVVRPSYLVVLLILLLWLAADERGHAAPTTLASPGSAGIPAASSAGDKLVFTQVIWRHGARAPMVVCPRDRNHEASWPAAGFSQLTKEGQMQHYELGQRLRRRYVDQLGLVNRTYVAKEVHYRSTDTDRTLLSAGANAAGFYEGQSPLNEGLPLVPIHGAEHGGDPFNAFDFCPRQWPVFDVAHQTKEFKEMQEEYKDLLDSVSTVCGTNVTFFGGDFPLWMVWDSFLVELHANRTWPEGLTPELFDRLHQYMARQSAFDFGFGFPPLVQGLNLKEELPRLRAGQVLWTLIDRMEAKRRCVLNATETGCEGLIELKYQTYSSHDVTQAGLFATLGVDRGENAWSNGYPHMAAATMVELWRRAQTNGTEEGQGGDDGFYVKVVYWPGYGDSKHGLELDLTAEVQGCGGNAAGCPLDAFIRRARPYQMLPSAFEVCNDVNIHQKESSTAGAHKDGQQH